MQKWWFYVEKTHFTQNIYFNLKKKPWNNENSPSKKSLIRVGLWDMKLFQSCLNLVRELLVDVIVIQVCSLLFIINVFVKTIDYCSTWASSTLNIYIFWNVAILNNQKFFFWRKIKNIMECLGIYHLSKWNPQN